MEDLDLDELDQAVNKLMDKPGKKASVKVAAEPAASPAVSDDSSVTVKTPATPAEPPKPEPARSVVVDRPMPKVPPRKRMHPGAMDIIQPAQKASAPSGRPNRTAAAIEPTKPVEPEKPAAPAVAPIEPPAKEPHDDVSDDVLAALSMLDEPKTAQPEPKKETGESWPDPLEFHGFTDDAKEEPKSPEPAAALPVAKAPEPIKEPAPTIEPKADAAPVPVHDDPLTSPFVTTKVEKRPLGAFADAQPEPTPEPEKPAEAPVPKDDANKGDMAKASLESNQHLDHPDSDHDMDDLRNMSIPQQYHTEQAKPNEQVHNVYDTKEYHAPPQTMHTAHKGGPWLVVGVVVLVVLIIAAVAVGYFMMMGTFDLTKIL